MCVLKCSFIVRVPLCHVIKGLATAAASYRLYVHNAQICAHAAVNCCYSLDVCMLHNAVEMITSFVACVCLEFVCLLLSSKSREGSQSYCRVDCKSGSLWNDHNHVSMFAINKCGIFNCCIGLFLHICKHTTLHYNCNICNLCFLVINTLISFAEF